MSSFLSPEQIIKNANTLNNGWKTEYALEAEGQGLFYFDRAVQVWVEGNCHLDNLEEQLEITPAERFSLDLQLITLCQSLEKEADAQAKGRAALKAQKTDTPKTTGGSRGLRSLLNKTSSAAAFDEADTLDEAANDDIN